MKNTKYADLHVHTNFSDGTFTPEEVVRCAKAKGLDSIAICDHDCTDAIDPAIAYAKTVSLEIIPGVELTVIENSREIHVLGYFISWHNENFAKILERVQKERIDRMQAMINKLKKFRIKVDMERVMEIAGNKGSVGRLHLAQALLEIKAVHSIKAAFNKYIGDMGPCYVEDVGFEAKEAIDLILSVGGVPVLAHPKSIGDDLVIIDFIKYGIRGIEVYHTDHVSSVSKKYVRLAREHNLLITGGSDCHGFGKGRVLLGEVKVPYELVEKLRQESDMRKK